MPVNVKDVEKVVKEMEKESKNLKIREYAIQCIKEEAHAVLDLIPRLDDNFDRAVEMIHRCHGKLIVTGVG